MNILKFVRNPFYGFQCAGEFLAYFMYNQRKLQKMHILNSLDTLDLIRKKKLSISRYGDGEFSVMRGNGNQFQQPDTALKKRLREVAGSSINNHLVCMPYSFITTELLDRRFRFPWKCVAAHNADMLLSILHPEQIYGDAQITRFYMDYADKSICPQILAKLKALWDKQDLCIIEGEKSRVGVSNDLFDNAGSIQRILCPAENAFSNYDKILARSLQIPKDKLVLISLGMTATVLAYDLCKNGHWAIDFGHMDIEYEWYKAQAVEKIRVEGKYISEVPGGKNVVNIENSEYEKQIVDRIYE